MKWIYFWFANSRLHSGHTKLWTQEVFVNKNFTQELTVACFLPWTCMLWNFYSFIYFYLVYFFFIFFFLRIKMFLLSDIHFFLQVSSKPKQRPQPSLNSTSFPVVVPRLPPPMPGTPCPPTIPTTSTTTSTTTAASLPSPKPVSRQH